MKDQKELPSYIDLLTERNRLREAVREIYLSAEVEIARDAEGNFIEGSEVYFKRSYILAILDKAAEVGE